MGYQMIIRKLGIVAIISQMCKKNWVITMHPSSRQLQQANTLFNAYSCLELHR